MKIKNLVLQDYIQRLETSIEEWETFLHQNYIVDMEQKALIHETVILLQISADLCYQITEEDKIPDTNTFYNRFIKVIDLINKVYEVLENVTGGDIPSLPW